MLAAAPMEVIAVQLGCNPYWENHPQHPPVAYTEVKSSLGRSLKGRKIFSSVLTTVKFTRKNRATKDAQT